MDPELKIVTVPFHSEFYLSRILTARHILLIIFVDESATDALDIACANNFAWIRDEIATVIEYCRIATWSHVHVGAPNKAAFAGGYIGALTELASIR